MRGAAVQGHVGFASEQGRARPGQKQGEGGVGRLWQNSSKMAIQGASGQIPHPILRVEGADVSAWGAGDGEGDAWVCTCWEAAESKWGGLESGLRMLTLRCPLLSHVTPGSEGRHRTLEFWGKG